MNHLFTFLIVLCVFIGTSNAFKKNVVLIRNSLQHNKDLKVHCKSKDDDLGFHILRPGGEYSFSFRDNFFETTLFWCNLWQGPGFKHHQVFDAYKADWYKLPNAEYKWEAREDGIYFAKDKQTFVFKYGWDVPHEANTPLSFEDENLSPN